MSEKDRKWGGVANLGSDNSYMSVFKIDITH